MLVLASTDTWLGILGGVTGIILGISSIIAIIFVARARRTTALATLQDQLVNSLQVKVSEQEKDLEHLRQKVEQQEITIKALQESVTQAAKVDALRDEQATGFKAIERKLNRILSAS